jgi:Uma2 family endonuclease
MTVATLPSTEKIAVKPKNKRHVPDYLVKEVIDGVRFYYRDYKKVLNKQQTVEEIMGCSALQSIIISFIMKVLFKNDADKKYYLLTNEVGHHISHKNNFSYDIALYDRNILTPDKITNRYVQEIAPKLVIEVETDISLDDTGMNSLREYWMKKTQKMLDNGTEKVIWVFSKNYKILVSEGEEWHIYNLDKTIQLLDNVMINIGEYLKEEKINIE